MELSGLRSMNRVDLTVAAKQVSGCASQLSCDEVKTTKQTKTTDECQALTKRQLTLSKHGKLRIHVNIWGHGARPKVSRHKDELTEHKINTTIPI